MPPLTEIFRPVAALLAIAVLRIGFNGNPRLLLLDPMRAARPAGTDFARAIDASVIEVAKRTGTSRSAIAYVELHAGGPVMPSGACEFRDYQHCGNAATIALTVNSTLGNADAVFSGFNGRVCISWALLVATGGIACLKKRWRRYA